MTTPTVTSAATDAATVIHTAADIARKTQFKPLSATLFYCNIACLIITDAGNIHILRTGTTTTTLDLNEARDDDQPIYFTAT